MNSRMRFLILVSFGFVTGAAAADDFDFIVLTDNVPADSITEAHGRSPDYARHQKKVAALRKAKREEVLAVLQRTKREMEQLGYSIASDEQLSAYDGYIAGSQVALQPLHEIEFGYRHAELGDPAIESGRLKGVYAVEESDGFVHQAAYLYEFDELGPVIIEELSYLTIPNARIAVTRPIGNLAINGFPATYTALTNRDNTKGLTGITFITGSKMFSVTALHCITEKDAELFDRLVTIASALN